jgi:hypothetical protein
VGLGMGRMLALDIESTTDRVSNRRVRRYGALLEFC